MSKNSTDVSVPKNSTESSKKKSASSRATLRDVVNAINERSEQTDKKLDKINEALTKKDKAKTSNGTTTKEQAEVLKQERLIQQIQENLDKHNKTQAQIEKLQADTQKSIASTDKLKAETKQIAQEVVTAFSDRKLTNEERRNKELRTQEQFELDTKQQIENFKTKQEESKAKTEKIYADIAINQAENSKKIANMQLDFDVKLDKHRITLEERSRLLEKREKEKPFFSRVFGTKDTTTQEEKAKAFKENYMKNNFSDTANLNIDENVGTTRKKDYKYRNNFKWEDFKPDYTDEEIQQSFENKFTQQVSDLINKATTAAQQFAEAANTQKENNEEIKKKKGRPKKSSSSSATNEAQKESLKTANEQLDLQKAILDQITIESKANDNVLKQLKFESDEKYKSKEDERASKKQEFDQKMELQALKIKQKESEIKISAIQSNQENKQRLDKIAIDNKLLGYQVALDKYKAWQEDREYELEKRRKEEKQASRESYKESATYRGVNAVKNAHSGFGTSIATSAALSALTGGVLNPILIQALKLDKLVTAPLEAMTKWMLSSKKKTLGTTSSAIRNSKNNPIIAEIRNVGTKLDKLNKEQEPGTTEKKSKGILGKIWDGFKDIFGIVGKGLMTLLGPAALIAMLPKVKEKAAELLQDFLTGKVGMGKEAAGNTSKIITDALPGVLAGFKYAGLKGALLGGALTYSIANLDKIKDAWNTFTGKQDDNDKITNLFGIPVEYVQGALTGMTIAGLTGGGLRRIAMGAIVGIGAMAINNIKDRFMNQLNGIDTGDKEPEMIGPIPKEYADAAIAGAAIGSLGGLKTAAIGAIVGITGQAAWNVGNDLINTITGMFTGTGTSISGDTYLEGAIAGAVAGYAAPGNAKIAKKIGIGAAIGIAIPWITKQVADLKAIFDGSGNYKANAKGLGEDILAGAIGGALIAAPNPMGMLIGGIIGASLPLIKSLVGDFDGTIAILKRGLASIAEFGKDLITHPIDTFKKLFNIGQEEETKIGKAYEEGKQEYNKNSPLSKQIETLVPNKITEDELIHKEDKKEELAKDITKITLDSIVNDEELNKGTILDNKYSDKGLTNAIVNATSSDLDRISQEEISDSEKGSGGYGKLERGKSVTSKGNPYKQDLAYRSEQYGIDTILLEDMGLHGSINDPWTSNGNSIPAISSKNKDSLQKLDKTLHDWGYDFTYTSAMGGHKFGTNHWKGNKVDLQIKTNKYPARMTPGQERALIEAGFAQNGTGAVGWEPHANQVGGGHYDLYLGDGDALQNITPNDSIGYAEALGGNIEMGDMFDLGFGSFADQFMKGLDSFGSAVEKLAFGNIAPSGLQTKSTSTGIKSTPNPIVSNAVQDMPKIQKNEEVMSTEMSTTNELAQLNNSLSGNKDNSDGSMKDIMANIANNTANTSKQQPVTYVNNISGGSSNSQDEHVYYTGDAAKSLLFSI